MKTTAYDSRYLSKTNYWDFKPSTMAFKVLELAPPLNKKLTLLDIGCGEGGNTIFFAKNGYKVTGFDFSAVGVQKTKENAEKHMSKSMCFSRTSMSSLAQRNTTLFFPRVLYSIFFQKDESHFFGICKLAQTKTAFMFFTPL